MHSGPVYQIVTNYMAGRTLEDMIKWMPHVACDTRFTDEHFPSDPIAGPYVETGRLVRYTHEVIAAEVEKSFTGQRFRPACAAELLAFVGTYHEDKRLPYGLEIAALGSRWQGRVPKATNRTRDDRDSGWNIDLIDVSDVWDNEVTFLAIHEK